MQMEQNSKHKNADCKSSHGKIFHTEKPQGETSGARTPGEDGDLKFSASNEEGDGGNKQRSRENITP